MNLSHAPRPVLLGGLAVASLLTLAGCGGSIAADAPTDADPTAFCNAYFDEEKSASDVADQLASIGTPSDISESERNGFEIYVDGLKDEGDTANADVSTVQIPADKQADGNAFVTYAGDLCAALPTPEDGASTDPAEPSATES